MNRYDLIKRYRYKKKISSLVISAFLQKAGIQVKLNDGLGNYKIVCPFNSSHPDASINYINENYGFLCTHCNHDFLDFLYLYNNDLVESCCVDNENITFDLKEKQTCPSPSLISDILILRNDFVVDLNGMIYMYDKKKWVEISKDFIKTLVLEIITDYYYKIKYVGEIISLFLAKIQSKDYIKWNNIDYHLIPCKNGVFDLIADALLCHKKEHYILTYVDCDYLGEKEMMQWHICKTSWFDKRGEEDLGYSEDFKKEDILQEFCGYCIMPKAMYKKAMIIYGPPNTGKSVFAAGIRNVIGTSNMCSIQVDKMGDEKALAPIKGKLVNMLTDLPKDALLSDGGFKALVSGGDPVQINEKFKPEQVIIPTCKHLFICNNLPKITDTTDAVFTRLIFLEFKNQISEKDRDPIVEQNIMKEKEGIFYWMIQGAKRILRNNGHFTASEDVSKSIKLYKHQENPINDFLNEEFVVDPEAVYKISDARDIYRSYSGNTKTSSKHISKLLRDAGIEVFEKSIHNKNYYVFKGYSKQI